MLHIEQHNSVSIVSQFRDAAKQFLAKRGTSLWALLGFAGDMAAFGSGIHFNNPARMTSMALGMAVAILLWAWGDYDNDKIKGGSIARNFAAARNRARLITDIGLTPQHMQRIGFIANIGTGALLCLAGLDLTHPKQSGFTGNDFRPIEMIYGCLIATAFIALSVENMLPDSEVAQRKLGKLFGRIFHKDNMRKVAAWCFMPCGVGQLAAGIVNRDPFVFTSGVMQNLGNMSLWYSTRLEKQMLVARGQQQKLVL